MKALYRDELENLAVMQVSKVSFLDEEEVLEICGPEEDIALKVTKEEAEKIVKKLYEAGKVDVTAFPYCEIEYEFDDDDEDEMEDEDEFDEMLNRILDDDRNGRGNLPFRK